MVERVGHFRVFGGGLCATACVKALRSAGVPFQRYRVHASDFKAQVAPVLHSAWRQPAPIYSLHPQGLSHFYHGVTDLSLASGHELSEARRAIGIPEFSFDLFRSHSWVPWWPIRPSPMTEAVDIALSKNRTDDTLIFCQSVIGNLQTLFHLKLLKDEIAVGDHVVVRLGHILREEITIVRLVQVTRHGPVFFHDDSLSSAARVFYRPRFNSGEETNFAESLGNRSRFVLKNLGIGKLLEASHLKIAVPRSANRYNVYAQIPIDDFYRLRDNSIFENPAAYDRFLEIYADICVNLKKKFFSFVGYDLGPGNILPGIHLFYDRGFLNSLPRNVVVYDTSLNPNKRAHPSVAAALRAYKLTLSIAT